MFDRDSKRGKRSGKLYSENGKKRYDQRLLTREARIRLTRNKTFSVISLGRKFCFLWFGSKKQGERLGCWKSITKSRSFGAHRSKDGGFPPGYLLQRLWVTAVLSSMVLAIVALYTQPPKQAPQHGDT